MIAVAIMTPEIAVTIALVTILIAGITMTAMLMITVPMKIEQR